MSSWLDDESDINQSEMIVPSSSSARSRSPTKITDLKLLDIKTELGVFEYRDLRFQRKPHLYLRSEKHWGQATDHFTEI